jgi:hypothetical protein
LLYSAPAHALDQRLNVVWRCLVRTDVPAAQAAMDDDEPWIDENETSIGCITPPQRLARSPGMSSR